MSRDGEIWARHRATAQGWTGRLRVLWAALGDNPVLRLSLRRGMRRGTTFALQFAYVLALMALVAILYLVVLNTPGAPGPAGKHMGKLLFLWLALLQTFFLSLTAAVLAGSSISLEREQRTFEALRLTRLSVGELLAGKYLSLLLLLTLLIVTSVPIGCLGFLFGGVAPAEVGRATLLTLASTAAALAVGLACSAFCRRSSLAVAAAAGIALGGLLGLPAACAFYAGYVQLSGSASDSLLCFLVVVNPFFAEGNLFESFRRVPAQAADANLLVQASVGTVAWLVAWWRLKGERED